MSLGKKRLIIVGVGGAILLAAAVGVLWSIAPIGGDTLPHLIEANTGVSFRLAALLVSLVSAVLGVIAMFVLSFYPVIPSDQLDGFKKNMKPAARGSGASVMKEDHD